MLWQRGGNSPLPPASGREPQDLCLRGKEVEGGTHSPRAPFRFCSATQRQMTRKLTRCRKSGGGGGSNSRQPKRDPPKRRSSAYPESFAILTKLNTSIHAADGALPFSLSRSLARSLTPAEASAAAAPCRKRAMHGGSPPATAILADQ